MSDINGRYLQQALVSILINAGKLVGVVKSGRIKHIFFAGSCDESNLGRNYYTEFVKQIPIDTLVLTLACRKYYFNYLDSGKFPI